MIKGLWARCPKTGFFGTLKIDQECCMFFVDHRSCFFEHIYQNIYSYSPNKPIGRLAIDWANLEIFTECEE